MKNGAPTRAEFMRLMAEHEQLKAEVAAVVETTRQLWQELKNQFTRIAEMQAILDERRIATSEHRDQAPIYRVSSSR